MDAGQKNLTVLTDAKVLKLNLTKPDASASGYY